MKIIDLLIGPRACVVRSCGCTDFTPRPAPTHGWDAKDYQAHLGRAYATCNRCQTRLVPHVMELTANTRKALYHANAVV